MRTLSGAPGAWNITRDTAAMSLRSVLSLVKVDDSLEHATLYVTDFLPGTLSQKEVEGALAYLFKEDVADSANLPPGFEGFKVLLPPGDGGHCGLLRLTDSTVTFLSLRGVLAPRLKGCPVQDLSIDTIRLGRENALEKEGQNRFLAVLLNTAGLKALEDSAYLIAQNRFQQAFALDSTVPEYLVNKAALFAVHNDPQGGVDLLLQYPALVESSDELCGILSAFYKELRHFPEARDWALKALQKNPDNHEWLINLSDALWGMDERTQSKNVLLKPYAEKPDFRLGVYLAGTYLGLEEYDSALSVLQRAQADTAPTPKSAAYTLRAYLGLSRFEDGLDFIRRLGRSFPVTAEDLFLKAACEYNLKLFRQAEESVNKSLRLNPSDREAEELQTRIAALMGDKSNQFLRAPLVPLPTTLSADEVRKMLRDSAWDRRFSDYPLYLIAQQIEHDWTPGGRWTQTRHLFFRVPDGARLIQFSELLFTLNPSFERFYINRLRIYNAKWVPVREGSLEDYYVTKNPDAGLHPENLLAHVVLKTLSGPLFVELLITTQAQVSSSEFPYVRFEQSAGYPIAYSRFELLHPPKKLLISPFGGVRIDSLADRVLLTVSTPSFPPEGNFSPESEAYASGFSAAPFATWSEVGLEYLDQLKRSGIDAMHPSLAARERASDLCDGNPSANPVRLLFQYVRDSIRYDNYELNMQAAIPDSVPVVLAKGHADCKGEALLLAQMLQARGIGARLCLVNLQHAGDAAQPHLNQFNHMVVEVPQPAGREPYFLDPTDKFSAFRRTPLSLEGYNALILDSARPQLVSIPEIDSSTEHSVRIFHEWTVTHTNMSYGRDSVVLQGKVAAEFRERLSAWNPGTRQDNLLNWLASDLASFNEDSFRILNEENPDEPLILVLAYHSRFPNLDGPQTFDYFPRLELSFLRFPDAGHRKTPVNFPHAINVESEWVYRLPSGFGWKAVSLARTWDQKYLHWQFSIEQDTPGVIQLNQRWHVDPFLVDPDEYRGLRADWDPALRSCGLKLAISPL